MITLWPNSRAGISMLWLKQPTRSGMTNLAASRWRLLMRQPGRCSIRQCIMRWLLLPHSLTQTADTEVRTAIFMTIRDIRPTLLSPFGIHTGLPCLFTASSSRNDIRTSSIRCWPSARSRANYRYGICTGVRQTAWSAIRVFHLWLMPS